jgi:dihydroorotate dehydrogenase
MTLLIDVALRLLRLLPPETAHRLTIYALATAPSRWMRAGAGDDPVLASRVFGLEFPNPIGLAAGFDKNAQVFHRISALGFGFAEIGSVTPRPQDGNPRPRLFRLPPDQAIINRMGFNNDGLPAVEARLRARSGLGRAIIGVNLGKNKDSPDAAADYAAGARAFAPLVDYLVVNISSPNTPGLRALQGRESLTALLAAVKGARDGTEKRPPLLLKVAPDLTEAEKKDIAEVALQGGVDGLVVANTTIARPAGLAGKARDQAGGLSGRPLFALSTSVLADMYRLSEGRLPMIGVGGIASAEDAYAKIRAGASLLQLYTALVYQGPSLIERIKQGLALRLRADGFTRLADAVGADHAARVT